MVSFFNLIFPGGAFLKELLFLPIDFQISIMSRR